LNVAIVQQPGIQVKRPVVRSKSVVRQNEQRCVIVNLWQHFSEHLIDLLIEFRNGCSVLRSKRWVVTRVFPVVQQPHHMRSKIKAGEIKEENALVELSDLGVENAPMLCEYGS